MAAILEEWLEGEGYTLVTREFRVSGRFADYVGLHEGHNKTVAIEVKSSSAELAAGIGQCLFYKRGVDSVYVALPASEVRKLSTADRELLRDLGIGLLFFNKEVKVIIEPREGTPKEGVIKRLKRGKKPELKASIYVEERLWEKFRESVNRKHGSSRKISEEASVALDSMLVEEWFKKGFDSLGVPWEPMISSRETKEDRPRAAGPESQEIIRGMRDARSDRLMLG